jgi:hypothetical protein
MKFNGVDETKLNYYRAVDDISFFINGKVNIYM